MTKSKTTVSPEKQPLKPPPLTGDGFVDSCFVLDFLPAPDERIGSRMDGLKDVPGLIRQGLLEDAWVILDTHHHNLKDLDFIYAFKALILQKNNQPDAAKKTLLVGLKFGRGKFLLYERLGFLAFETGRLSEAVTWWIKSIVAMKMLDRLTMWEPFLYLAGVAKALSSETHFRILTAWVQKISPHGELSLDDNSLNRLNEQAPGLCAASVLKALDILCLHYIPKAEDQPCPALPGIHPPGHPNVPATRDHLSAFSTLFGENKRKARVTRLVVTLLALALILFFLLFLKSPEDKPDIKEAASLPKIRQNFEPAGETKHPPLVSKPQLPDTSAREKSEEAAEIEPEKEKSIEPAAEQIRHKEKYPLLKAKTNDRGPDGKPKE